MRPGFRDPFCHPARRLGKGCAKKWLILHLVLELLSSRDNPGRIRTLPRLGERRAKGPKMARKLAPGWPTRGRRSRHIAGGSGGDRPGQRAFAPFRDEVFLEISSSMSLLQQFRSAPLQAARTIRHRIYETEYLGTRTRRHALGRLPTPPPLPENLLLRLHKKLP